MPVWAPRYFAGCNLRTTTCHDCRDYHSGCKTFHASCWCSQISHLLGERTQLWLCTVREFQNSEGTQPPAVVSFPPQKRHKGSQARAGVQYLSRSLDKLLRQLYWRSQRGPNKARSPNSLFLSYQSGQVTLHMKNIKRFLHNSIDTQSKTPVKQQFCWLLFQVLNTQTDTFIRK